MSYAHAATLTSSGTAASFTFSPVPVDKRIAIQCSGADCRVKFGVGSATAANDAGVRILADSPPECIDLVGNLDTISIILDANGTGTTTVEIMTAPRLP